MTRPTSYTIRHIALADTATMGALTASESGWYLVVWWQQIPVGQVFAEPGESLTPVQLEQRLIAAIRPIFHDGSNTPISNLADLKVRLDVRLRALEPASVPPRVPVTVVICTRSRATQLADALDSLLALPCRPDEIVVIDNAPTDDSTARTVALFTGVTYRLEPRPGLDIARNTGVLTARMPIVAFIDDDVRVHPYWAYRVWETFQRTDVSAMTGLVIAADLQTDAQVLFEKHWSFNRGYVDKIYDSTYVDRHRDNGPPVWEIGAGANMAFRRQVFDRVGLFDERLDVGAAGCNGDSEMWFRLLAQGFTIQYNPRAVAYHEHRQTFGALKRQLFSYMRGHIAAALIQHSQYPQAGYRHYLLRNLPLYYLLLLKAGFPTYRFRYRTLGSELRGLLSGLLFFLRNRQRSSSPINSQVHENQPVFQKNRQLSTPDG